MGTASLEKNKRRLLGTKAKPLDVEPLADALTKSIVDHASDPHLRWDSNGKVKVLIGEIIPATNKQTTSARRKRFWKALEERIHAHGWKRLSPSSQFLQK
jgi:hypothetical protein